MLWWRWGRNAPEMFPGMEESLLSVFYNPLALHLLSYTVVILRDCSFASKTSSMQNPLLIELADELGTQKRLFHVKHAAHLQALVFTLPCCLSFMAVKICLVGWLFQSTIYGVLLVKQWHKIIIFIPFEWKNHKSFLVKITTMFIYFY